MRKVNSDVTVLTNKLFHHLNLSDLWIGFGTGKPYIYRYTDISIQHSSQMIGHQRGEMFPFCHRMRCLKLNNDCMECMVRLYSLATDTNLGVIQDPINHTLDSLHIRDVLRTGLY